MDRIVSSLHEHHFASIAIDRVAHRRSDREWVRGRLAGSARIAPVWRGRSFVHLRPSPRAAFVPARQAARLLRRGRPLVLLGLLRRRAVFALDVSDLERPERHPELRGRGAFAGLRRVGLLLGAGDAGTLAHARAMVYWHRRHRFCGVCGAATRSRDAGHLRVCSAPGCRLEHFPRTDPAVIVRVEHEDRCLLGHRTGWPRERYSVLAGFVEPGEGLEAAVTREVHEESGVVVHDVRYDSSQPWPFPASLMLGFTARALDPRLRLDRAEIDHACWVSREDLARRLGDGSLRLPPSTSIARHLIEMWRER